MINRFQNSLGAIFAVSLTSLILSACGGVDPDLELDEGKAEETKKVELSGTVLTRSGKPAPWIGIQILGMEKTRLSTDARGEFEARLAPGSYQVWVMAPGCQEENTAIELKAGSLHHEIIQLPCFDYLNEAPEVQDTAEEAPKRLLFRGTVVDGEGAPVMFASVSLNGTENRRTSVDSNGHFSFITAPGLYEVVLNSLYINQATVGLGPASSGACPAAAARPGRAGGCPAGSRSSWGG